MLVKLIPIFLIGISAGLSAVALANDPPSSTDTVDSTEIDIFVAQSPNLQVEEVQIEDLQPEEATNDSESSDQLTALLEEENAEEATSLLPFTTSLSIDSSTSVGNLVYNRSDCSLDIDPLETEGSHCDLRNVVSQSYRLGFSYALPIEQTIMLGANFGFSKFLTRAGGSQELYEGRYQDTSISLVAPAIYTIPIADIGITLSGSATLPTSRMSRFARLRTGLNAGIGFSRSFGGFSVQYSAGYGQNFHAYHSIVFDPSDSDNADYVPVHRDDELVASDALLLTSGMLTQRSFTNTLALSFNWLEAFNTSLSFTRSDAFAYNSAVENAEDDEYRPENMILTRHRDMIVGSFSQAYTINNYLSVSAALRTVQQPKTADNQSVHFPFFDTQTGNISRSSVFFNLTARY